MIKKEFRDTFIILLQSASVLLSVPIMLGLLFIMDTTIPTKELVYAISMITVCVFAGYSGLAMFQTEKRDNGFEYLLTLPLSKLKVFMFKWLPRLAVLLVVSALWPLIFDGPGKEWVLFLVMVQLAGVFLSLAFNTLFAGFITSVILACLFALINMYSTYLVFYTLILPYQLQTFTVAVSGAMLCFLVPLGISFFLVYRNYDLRPYKLRIRPYLYIALPVIAFFSIAAMLNFEVVSRYL